jgi:transcriptional regulator with XRE-family HTH domain
MSYCMTVKVGDTTAIVRVSGRRPTPTPCQFCKCEHTKLCDKITRSYVSKIENGRTTPTLATFERIAKVLDTEGWRLLRWASRQSDEPATPEVIA